MLASPDSEISQQDSSALSLAYNKTKTQYQHKLSALISDKMLCEDEDYDHHSAQIHETSTRSFNANTTDTHR